MTSPINGMAPCTCLFLVGKKCRDWSHAVIFSWCLSWWEVALASNGRFPEKHNFFLCLQVAGIQNKNQVLSIHISETISKTDQQRVLVSPQMGKSHVFGYPVTNGLEKLLGEALNIEGHCAECNCIQVFSTF